MRLHSASLPPRLLRVLAVFSLLPTAALAAGGGEPAARGFGFADWAVVVIYALVLIGIGLYYSRRQTTSEEYFVASRSVAPFLAGISLYATMFSTLSYIGFPGEMIQNGPILLVISIVSMPIIYLIVGYWVIPLVMKLPVTSAYELLETRLGNGVRLLGSGIFVLTRIVWMALMLYTTSLVLVTIMGWNPAWAVPLSIVTGVLTTAYTLTGGLRAVVVSDVVQFFVLLGGAVFTLIFITVALGGVGGWWPHHWAPHWSPQPFFSLDPSVRVTMVGTFVGAIIWWTCTSASDQMAIQRYLSTRDAATARRAFLHNCVGCAVVNALLAVVGLAVLAFYTKNPSFLPAGVSPSHRADALFPHYVSHFLPTGIPGIVLAGLLAAAMSSLSSGINSTITVVSKDFIERFWPQAQRTDASRLKTAHLLAAAIGLIAIAGSQLAGTIPGNLIEVVGKSNNLFVCPLFGLFFLALFVPFATPFGAVMGALYSFAAALLAAYWQPITGGIAVSFQWIAPVSLVVSLASGCLFSLLPTRGRSKGVIGAYSAAAAVPWVVLLAAVC